jgi:hypothetical protein
VVVQIGVVLVPSYSLIVSPAVPVPVIVGVESLLTTGVVELAGLVSVVVMIGATGVVVGVKQLPVTSDTVITTGWTPYSLE